MTKTLHTSKRIVAALVLACVSAMLLAATALAGTSSVQFASPKYTADESQTQAVLTLTRSGDLRGTTRIYYFTEQPSPQDSAIPDIDYSQINTHHPASVTFGPGQSTAQIKVPITDHGMPTPPKQFSVKVFAKGVVGAADTAAVRIIGNDPMPAVRDPSDPLALGASGTGYKTVPTAAPASAMVSNPLAKARFYVAPIVPLTNQYSQPQANLFLETSAANMHYKKALEPILQQPQQMRFGTWDINAQGVDRTNIDVSNYLEQAQANSPGTVPEILTYDLCHNSCKLPGNGKPALLPVQACGHKADTPRQVAAFENFINLMASGISDHRVVLYLEMDGLISIQCLSPQGEQTRLKELSYAIDTLSVLPRAAIYVDAGAADAGVYKPVAAELNKIGVQKLQGFFLNSTHADWTLNEVAYGQKISRLTGGAHFIVNTTVNGRGPEKTKDPAKDGNEVLCNPTTLGLGPKPTTNTGYWHVDAFAWLGYAGLSDGPCPLTPQDPFQDPTGTFMPHYAELLIQHADYSVRGTVPASSVQHVS